MLDLLCKIFIYNCNYKTIKKRKEKCMKEKVFYLHIVYSYPLEGMVADDLVIEDTDYEFKEDGSSETELNESGKPTLTPEILGAIRSELKKKIGVEKLTILNWQWYE